MSQDVAGGLDYARLKRHYDANDFISVNFATPGMAIADYYVVGLNAYFADPTVADYLKGWMLFAHGQPAYPAWNQLVALALGIVLPTLPVEFPAFEAKETIFFATAAMNVRFDRQARVAHVIPPNLPIYVHERFSMLFFTPVVPGAGILSMSFFG